MAIRYGLSNPSALFTIEACGNGKHDGSSPSQTAEKEEAEVRVYQSTMTNHQICGCF